MLPDLTVTAWLGLAVAAAFAGFSKTAIAGAGVVTATLAALVLPARESTGVVLPLLVCGDVLAVSLYRRSANWRLIGRLLPWVMIGILAGVAFLDRVRDDATIRVVIGVAVLLVIGLHVVLGARLREHLTRDAGRTTAAQHVAAAAAGLGVGFTTMIANAAGSVMTVYLLLSGVTMLEFLGTGAWFFLLVNLSKAPFRIALGIIDLGSLALDAALLPGLVAGAAVGRWVITRIQPRQFERVLLVMAALSAALLLV